MQMIYTIFPLKHAWNRQNNPARFSSPFTRNEHWHIQYLSLNFNLLTTTIFAPPSNASKWQMGFNSAFKGLNNILGEQLQNKHYCLL